MNNNNTTIMNNICVKMDRNIQKKVNVNVMSLVFGVLLKYFNLTLR